MKEMVDFVLWLNELFAEVKITNFKIEVDTDSGAVIALTSVERDWFSIVEKIVSPRIPPGGVWDFDAFLCYAGTRLFENISYEVRYVSEAFELYDHDKNGRIIHCIK